MPSTQGDTPSGAVDTISAAPPHVPVDARGATLVLSARAVRDLELVLLGLLPAGQVLGETVTASADGELTGVRLGAGQTGPERTAGLVLVDEEQTPLGELVGPLVTVTGADGAADPVSADTAYPAQPVVRGRLVARRRRESGAGRDRALSPADLESPWSDVVVLSRPVTVADDLTGSGPATLVLVPDHPSGTDGVPAATMLALGDGLAARLGGATVRSAPISWRDPDSDALLLEALRDGFTGIRGAGGLRLLRAGDGSAGADAWRTARAHLDEPGPADDTHAQVLSPEDLARIEAWRPPRARRGLVLLFSGLSGSGKSTVARALAGRIAEETTRTVSLLDGDVVRQLLSSGLGFDRESRLVNLRRIGYVAAEVARHGGIAICAPIAPYAAIRAELRAMAEQAGADFVLVHVSTPLAECERRDLKGLYAKARAGLIPEFTGISDPYETPEDADLRVDTSTMDVAEATGAVFDHLLRGGWITGATHAH